MKRLLNAYKPNMARPIIYKSITRFMIGLILAVLWDRFINAKGYYSMVEHAFFFFGMVFFALAWVSYLRIDGFKVHHLNEDRKKTKRKNHKIKNMIDFVDEEKDPADSFDENETIFVGFCANILTGACFILPSIISLLFTH